MSGLFWISLLLFYGAWTLPAYWVSRKWVEASWVPERAMSAAGARALAAAGLLLIVLPAGFGVWLMVAGIAPLGAGVGLRRVRPDLPLVVLGPQMLISAWLAFRMARLERAAAGDSDPLNLRAAFRSYLWRGLAFPGTILLFLGFTSLPLAGSTGRYVWLVPYAIIGSRLAYRFFLKRRPGRGFPMDDTPLRSEIVAAGYRFGAELKNLTVRTGRKPRPTYKLPLLEIPYAPVRNYSAQDAFAIPLPCFLHLDPDALTAGLCQTWARNLEPDSVLAGMRANSRALAALVMGLMVFFGVIISMFFLGFWFSEFSPQGWMTGILTALTGFGAVAYIWYLAGRRMGKFPTPEEVHTGAFGIWSNADKYSVRGPEEYVIALARYRAFHLAICRPEVVIHQLSRDAGLKCFLEKCGPGVRESALEAARRALEEPSSRQEVSAG